MNSADSYKLLELFADLCEELHAEDKSRTLRAPISYIGINIDKILGLNNGATWLETSKALRKRLNSPDLEWDGHVLLLNGSKIAEITVDRDYWHTLMIGGRRAKSSDRDTAAALAVLLAGGDPGGGWTLYNCPVTALVVRETCENHVVSWKLQT